MDRPIYSTYGVSHSLDNLSSEWFNILFFCIRGSNKVLFAQVKEKKIQRLHLYGHICPTRAGFAGLLFILTGVMQNKKKYILFVSQLLLN